MNNIVPIQLFCDGACSGNGKPTAKGGWGVVLKYGDYEKEFSGILEPQIIPATNQRAEIQAVISGLSQVKPGWQHIPVVVTSDSQYVISTMTLGWKKNANKDLWEQLDAIVAQFKEIKWNWVRGHAENKYNNRCDKLAVAAIKKGA